MANKISMFHEYYITKIWKFFIKKKKKIIENILNISLRKKFFFS